MATAEPPIDRPLSSSALPAQDEVAGVPVPADRAPTRRAIKIATVFVASLLICLILYLAVAVPAAWFPSASPRAWGAKDLTVARGTGTLAGGEMVITSADATGNVLVTLTSDFRSGDFAGIAWIAIDLPEDANAQLFWRNEYRPGKLNAVPMVIESGRILPVVLAGNPDWVGRVTGLAVAVKGTLAKPIRIRGVVAKPMGAFEVLRDRAGEWFVFEGWTGTSINTVTGGADVQDLPLPMLVAAAALLTVGIAFLWFRFRHGASKVPMAGVLVGAFVAAWFLLDLRWSWNLGRQVMATADQYAGKNYRDKHLAMVDGPLYAFIERARAILPQEPARVFVVADAAFYRNRAAYHLYPHNVYAEPVANAMPSAASMRPGDWLVVVQRRNVQFDAAQQKLRWEGDQVVAAEMKLVEPGYALFKVL